ncbi:fungal-specific transcription factor domain-containing protein [Aspergillus pseudoustus]|uniref:Fungal-specific transcription factor domain-containing protein n=1 Tax=Aspergillus pseudoustus TaxID=1810923 RepID=A0ABR4KJS8_9EURO
MPRPRRPGAPEPKRRSRKGCWPCKAKKVKCGEEKPSCLNCRRQNEPCDYSLRLNWGGRTRRKSSVDSPSSQTSSLSRHSFSFPLSPPSLPQTHPAGPVRPFNPSGWEVNTPQDEPAEKLFWKGESAGDMAVGRSYPSRLHDFHDSHPDQSFNACNRTTDRAPVEMDLSRGQAAGSWLGISHETTFPLIGDDLSNRPSVANTLENPRYPPPQGTVPNVPSLFDFNFPSGQVSQPISFVRPALDATNYTLHGSPFERGRMLDYQHNPAGLPSEIGARSGSIDCTLSPTDSHDATSPRSLDTSLFTSGTPRDPGDSPDSFLGGIVDGPPGDNVCRAKHARSYSSYARHHDIRPTLSKRRELSNSERKWQTYLTSVTDHYGMDCGRSDLDLGRNDDHSAIDVSDALEVIQSQAASHVSSPGGYQPEKDRNVIDSSKYAYYALPVAINIPRYLSPLPPSLVEVPINLMYFHHFLNHTARVLVPHDCGGNPFSSVLPSMAIGDSNLLNLMLAYSASHRARFLGHPEPANRIALWVRDVFPSLRLALEDPHEYLTDSHLATAIMLLSLEIVSPGAFEVSVPWQTLLKLARDLFLARQGYMASSGNRVGAFLTRWLGYLDVLGALSCRHHQPPLLEYYTVLGICHAGEDWDEFAVDCFTGFTPRTGLFLTQLGGLVHQCDNERFGDLQTFLPEWTPSLNIASRAEALIDDWETLDAQVHAHDKHYQDSESSDMIAVDRAFRYAGLLHLRRRVLGEHSDSGEVLKALSGLMQAVMTIRSGAATEAGVLFPIFTAGCETQDPEQRVEIKERLEVLEGTGMKQIQSARTLMQRCWDTDLPWIAFAQGEFLG